MKGILTVFGFTFREQVRKKSYIISTILLVVLTVAALCVPNLINYYQNRNNKQNTGESGKKAGTLYIVDNANILPDSKLALSDYKIDLQPQSKTDQLIESVKKSDKDALAVIHLQNGLLTYDYYVKSASVGPDPSTLSAVFRNAYSTRLLQENKVPGNVIASVLSEVGYKLHETGKGMLSGYLPAILVSFLLFFTIYFYGYWVAMSIASEKTSRVMELLITSTRPSRIVIGKSIAMGLLGLLQIALVILAAVATYLTAFPKNFKIGSLSIDFSGFTPFYAFMIILYFLLGYAFYAMMNAVAGATVSNADDVRTAIMPISFISLIAFYFSYGTLLLPQGTSSVAASIIPFSSPFSMPSRILMSGVPAAQILISLALLTLSTVLLAAFSIKLYSSAVLHYGKKLKFSELMRMSKSN